MYNNKIIRFVIWICSKFTKIEIEQIILELHKILSNQNTEIKPKDSFKQEHPNYQKFDVDPKPPIKNVKKKTLDYNELLLKFQADFGKKITPVKYRNKSIAIPENIICHHCGAPHIYIYFNNGNQKSQFKCKVCNLTFKDDLIHKKPDIFCPYCNNALYKWKERTDFTIYKCSDNQCPRYIESYNALNEKEKVLFKKQPYNFTLHYHYHDYHFDIEQLKHSEPDKPIVDLTKIHNSQNILGLILTFFVSFSIPARKTALLLRWVFNINISYQTVLNYTQSASYYCQQFNMKYKGDVDNTMPGDETYIKVSGNNNFIWFFISENRRNIASYHYSTSRDTQHAIISMNEASRTAKPDQSITFITDGNPAYVAALHYINEAKGTNNPYGHHKVIGLQNLDEESEKYRTFKQLIERLNRTYKSHVRQAQGFGSSSGAIALTTLFVTFYNFLRPHQSLKYNVPVQLDFLKGISTIQAKWLKILSMAYG